MKLARLVLLALGLAVAFAASASAASSKPTYGKLSQRLGELAAPGVRSATPAEQADAVDLPRRGPASLVRRGDDVVVEIRVAPGTGLDALRAAGARVIHVSDRYDTVTAAVDPFDLTAVAAVPGVDGVQESLAPMVGGVADPQSQTGLNTCAGARTSEGDSLLKAGPLRSELDVDGAGVKVGVLSDSYDQAAAPTNASGDVASGDLPGPGNPCGRTTPVQVLDDTVTTGNDEGRAMLQIVHDLAPGSPLAFATASTSITSFADNIRALQAAGARVIVDDVTYFREPFFQDGPISVAVNDVTALGASYFSDAANNNLRDSGRRDFASWESPAFRDGGDCPGSAPAFATQCEDFNPGAANDQTFRLSVADGATLRIVLQWAQPWNGVTTDLDAYLLDGAGTVLSQAQNSNVTSTQQPSEVLTWLNNTGGSASVNLLVNRYTAAGVGDSGTPRVKFAIVQNGGGVTASEYPTSIAPDVVGPTIFGHNGAANATSVAAAKYTETTSKPEDYSSRGPATLYFGPVSGTTPAAALPSPQVLSKPDVTAVDCTQTTFFLGGSPPRFCGTSAAAPHAAAVGALQLQAQPSLTPAGLRSLQTSTATPIPGFGPAAVGGGLLNAGGFLAPPSVAVSDSAAPLSGNRTPTFTFSASRPSTFSCSIDGVAAACTSPFKAPALADGRHTLTVSATDVFGHTGSDSSDAFSVDGTAPASTITDGPSGLTRDAQPTFRFASDDPAARFECRFDAEPFGACSGRDAARAPARLTDGSHTFDVRGIDVVPNVGAPAGRAFIVDTRAPGVKLRRHPAKTTSARRARFRFSASEKGATFECNLDRGRFENCRNPLVVRVRAGRHVFRVRAKDAAGNSSRAETFRWRIL